MNPYLFIVGCPRSGTTLLGRMVDAHPLIAIIHETRWIADWFEDRTGLTPEGLVTPELPRRLAEHSRFATLDLKERDLEGLLAPDGPPPSFADFVTGIFDLYGRERGKEIVGDKTPRYVRSLPTLHRLWPGTRFLHIIRDGRDVYLSATAWRSGGELRRRFAPLHEDRVAITAVWWEWLVRLGREDGRQLGPALYHEVSYESLVVRPAEECASLCGFLGVAYEESMLHFHEGRERPKPGRSAKSAWLRVTSGLRDWRDQMEDRDVERFEAAAGALLDELGLERVFPNPAPEYVERAARAREVLVRELRARGDRIPNSWRT